MQVDRFAPAVRLAIGIDESEDLGIGRQVE